VFGKQKALAITVEQSNDNDIMKATQWISVTPNMTRSVSWNMMFNDYNTVAMAHREGWIMTPQYHYQVYSGRLAKNSPLLPALVSFYMTKHCCFVMLFNMRCDCLDITVNLLISVVIVVMRV
jgi:hypothetical protein